MPAREFLTSPTLPIADRDEILAAMKDVQLKGLPVARHLRGDIYEVRATGAHGSYRGPVRDRRDPRPGAARRVRVQ
jgi:hypothetical protein